ncbi:MAG: hypothetical protein CO189_07185 [candidate division Zixibacteria bacterium CG_4_9_14_3_um_filter_46_8]|nr:MAG: hypothetical protein CO189_07185 [candidate division Zixibacteria bacterium CG_4_9_14_3_um_filter_46_8]
MNIKKNPNHKIYIELLRKMLPEKKLRIACEMSDFTRKLFAQGLRKLHPELSEEEFKKLLFKRLEKCHNRNW